MKRISCLSVARAGLVAVAGLVVCGAPAVWADPDVGCGLGTQIWEGQSGSVVKAFAATTNGTSGNQTFGVTSGTCGCNQGGTVTAEARLRMFASANLDTLARDMAHGEGETLQAFSRLWGVAPADQAAFFAFTRTHFEDLFADESVTAGRMLEVLQELLAEDRALAVYAQI